MKSMSVTTAAKQVGLWLLLGVVVALLTLLFSLLGTIATAVIVGMMMGAARRWNWRAIAVALVFPVVAFALGQTAREDLDLRQRVGVAALCFGAFWGTYFLTYALMRLEQKPRAALRESSSRLPQAGSLPTLAAEAGGHRANGPAPTGVRVTAAAPVTLRLEDLDGTWLFATNGSDGEPQRRKIEIAEGKFALSLLNANGGAQVVAHGEVKLEGADGKPTLVFSDTSAPAAGSG